MFRSVFEACLRKWFEFLLELDVLLRTGLRTKKKENINLLRLRNKSEFFSDAELEEYQRFFTKKNRSKRRIPSRSPSFVEGLSSNKIIFDWPWLLEFLRVIFKNQSKFYSLSSSGDSASNVGVFFQGIRPILVFF